MASEQIYLDTYVLQQDMRVRLPKSVLANLEIEKGKSRFDIFIDLKTKELILKVRKEEEK